MRGKPLRFLVFDPCGRIIPAHAGQTTIFSFNSARWSDHPRACGANGVWDVFNIRGHGSSPRMRGKPAVIYPRLGARRIIPAHAGQTEKSHQKQWFAPDHPRACGANSASNEAAMTRFGSSPRMRGKQGRVRADPIRRRIIPAHAGQTRTPSSRSRPPPDHPRACGANQSGRPACIGVCGSSPRMRGKRCVGHVQHPWPRIIPAHAGQTH